jgi:hypothetical protein
VIVWEGTGPGDDYGIYAQRYNAAGQKQGGEFRVNTTLPLAQHAPAVAMDADGDFVVAWESGAYGFGYRIFAQRFNATGVKQGGELQANVITSGFKVRPDAAMDDVGNFIVTWDSFGQDGAAYGVYARRYDAAGVAQGTEFRVNTFTTGDQQWSAVAMDGDGDFLVTWTDTTQDGSSFGIYAQLYNASGAAQGGEFRVNQTTANPQSHSDVATDSGGDFVVTWQSYAQDAFDYGIYARTLNAAGVLQQDEFFVNNNVVGSQTEPAVAMSADGKAIVAWQGPDAMNGGIFARRLVQGVPPPSTVGGEFRVNTYTTNGQDLPAVAMDDAGNSVVVWESNGQDGSDYGIYAQRYNAAGAPQGPEFLVNTATQNLQYAPDVAMDDDGDFVVIWHTGVIAGQRFNAAGVPQGEEFELPTAVPHLYPKVAMDADGDFVVTWEEYQNGDLQIFAQRFNAAGAAQGGEIHVNIPGADQFGPAIDMDSDGNFVIAWQISFFNDFDRDIVARRFNASGQPQGDPFFVNTTINDYQYLPSIAMHEDGDFVVAWVSRGQDRPNSDGVFAQRFDAAGVKQGGEFQVNTHTTGAQRRPAVLMDDGGDFVIAWDSFAQQAPNTYGVYAQRYSAAGTAIGGEFRVSTTPNPMTPNNFGAQPTGAMDNDGDFIVVWANLGKDGSSYGVYAQRYAATTAVAPQVSASSFDHNTAPHALRFTFTQNVSASLGVDDLVLENLTTSTTIPSNQLALSYDAPTNTATFTYTGASGEVALPDGDYRATLNAAGVTNSSGTPMAANYGFDFFFLAGDANHDRKVDVADLGILATNWQQSPRTFSQGDFDYSGTVDVNDLGMLATRWQRTLAAASPASAPSTLRKPKAASRIATDVL